MQIELFEGAGEHTVVSCEDQYETALAYLAEGYCSHRPQLVRSAHKLLAGVKMQTESGKEASDIGAYIPTMLLQQ